MLSPSNSMNKAGNGWKAKLIHCSGFMYFLAPAIQDLIGPADLIIVQRNIVNDEVINAMQYWQGMGKPVVVDLDDAYQMLPWSNHARAFWHNKEDGKYFKILTRGLRVSEGLISPNR